MVSVDEYDKTSPLSMETAQQQKNNKKASPMKSSMKRTGLKYALNKNKMMTSLPNCIKEELDEKDEKNNGGSFAKSPI